MTICQLTVEQRGPPHTYSVIAPQTTHRPHSLNAKRTKLKFIVANKKKKKTHVNILNKPQLISFEILNSVAVQNNSTSNGNYTNYGFEKGHHNGNN